MVLLIDAEHSHLQPAVRVITLAMMSAFNRSGDVVLCNTYQCYLKDTVEAVSADMQAGMLYEL